MIDYTITLGNIIEISSIVGGGLLVLITLKSDVKSLKREFAGMQEEIKKLGEVLIKLAVAETRIANVESDIRELRRGHGWVTSQSRETVDGEYK